MASNSVPADCTIQSSVQSNDGQAFIGSTIKAKNVNFYTHLNSSSPSRRLLRPTKITIPTKKKNKNKKQPNAKKDFNAPWHTYNPATSGKVVQPFHVHSVSTICSDIEASYKRYLPSSPLHFGLPDLRSFSPYRVEFRQEKSILTGQKVTQLVREAQQLSVCDFFSKPDNIRFDAIWNGEKDLSYKELSTSTIKDALLLMNVDMHRRNERFSTKKFFFHCILQVYRFQVNESEFSRFRMELNSYDKATNDACLCLLSLCYQLGPEWDGWHLSVITCLLQNSSISGIKEYFKSTQRPAAFFILLERFKHLRPPPPTIDNKTAVDYLQDILGADK